MIQHFVNVSGGKDSTATYLLALDRGKPFRAIMADTGHEAEQTMEYAQRLGERTGGPAVEFVRADFSAGMETKRKFVETKWRERGVPEDTVLRALAALRPTGIPFLDLCIWKGRFPVSKTRFCTEELKAKPLDKIISEALLSGRVTQWLGIRRDESLRRANAPMFQRVRFDDRHDMLLFRPLIHWTADDVFALHRRHGLEPNPLYLQGMSRVGCWPCIFARKSELAEIARRYPEAFERLVEWERLVAEASKRGAATFFAGDVTPEGARMSAQGISGARGGPQYPGAMAVAEWARTDRGGRQFNLMTWAADMDDGLSCSSQYGLCE